MCAERVKKEGSGEKKESERKTGGEVCEYDSILVIKHIKVDLSEII